MIAAPSSAAIARVVLRQFTRMRIQARWRKKKRVHEKRQSEQEEMDSSRLTFSCSSASGGRESSSYRASSLPPSASSCTSGFSSRRRRERRTVSPSSSFISSDSIPSRSQKAAASGDVSRREEDELTEADISVKREAAAGLLWDDEEDDPYVVMSAVWGGGMLGMAYFIVDTGHLYIMPDSVEREDFGLLRRVLLQVQPRVILASARVDERMQKVLDDYTASPVSGGTETEILTRVELLPSGDFRVESCRQRLLSGIRLPGVNPEGSEEEKMVQVSCLFPLESVNLVRCVGALLKYVERKRLGMELEEEGVRVPVLAVKHFSLDNLLVMDESSFSALQIFQKEYHPSVYKSGVSGMKEGLSLFGIVNKTRSFLGSKLLKLWFLRPLCDVIILVQRQDAVEFLMKPRNDETTVMLYDCIKNIKNIPRILTKMNIAQASMNDWQSLYKCAYNGIYIGDTCRSLPKSINIFQKVSSEFSDDLHRIASLITKIVDFEESSVQQRFCVKPHVDDELDKLKELYNGLPDLLTKIAHDELEKLQGLSECNITYFPQLGYLTVITKTEAEEKREWLHEMGLSLVFETGNLSHFKSEKMRELDGSLGDIQCEIQDHETAIMHRLQEVILEHASSLLTVVELSAELDCLISLAMFAREHNCVRPQLTDENVIHIKGGRHPLQELVVSTFVPNDTYLDLEHGRMKFLTGANSSGKSIYLKQVALIVFLAHMGSFVPAETAKIGMTDHIYTRIQTRESVSVGLSAFMIDVNQVAAALNGATHRSLVLLDEFGKGTGTRDGMSLLVSSLKYWLDMKEACPNVLVSTHFHGVVEQKLLPSSPLLQYLKMETMEDGEELVFLYQISPGTCDSSHAAHIATLAGIPKEVVERGKQVTELFKKNQPIPRLDTPSMEEKIRVSEKIVSRFLKLDLEKDDLESFLKDFVRPTGKGIL